MKKVLKSITILLFSAFSICFLLILLHKPILVSCQQMLASSHYCYSFSQAIYDKNGQLLRLTLSHDDKYRLYKPLTQISPVLQQVTLLQEDQYFRWHFGVNPYSMVKAIWQTYVLKSRRMGASTITMQVARMLFHLDSKTISGKIWQIIRAIQLELHYSKNEILEAYLNMAPYGNNVEGVGAASLIYFGKPANEITLPEAMTLSVIPQNPTKRSPAEQGDTTLKHSRDKLFNRWIQKHPQDSNKQALMNLPIQLQTAKALPFLAPHFVNLVLQDSNDNEIKTSLNLHLQKILEHVTQLYLSAKKNIGVNNASVLLIDTRDMSVKALVGSADFFDKTIQGQINGTTIKRSPGSTLKPFIYGLALDQGLIHPATVLKDVPRSFGNYNPENFDYDFMGPVTAKEALIFSRNIPAIYLADQISKPNLYQFLQAAHISHLKSESFYGLGIALGGADLSMIELTQLYAMLVNQGLWQPIQFQKKKSANDYKRLLSPEASYLVLDMLKDTPRPDFTRNDIPVSWKTGTSSGYRDAWTIGAFGPYVLTVWVGNFNNNSNPAFVGKTIAAPLFFELIDAIHQEVKLFPIVNHSPATLNLREIPVCKASGLLPTRYCKDTQLTLFIPGKSPIKTDNIFREIAIDKKTGLRTCQFNQNTRFEIYEFWPSDLLRIFKQAGVQRRTPPAYDASCLAMQNGNSGINPQITSPQTETQYIIQANAPKNTIIPLSAVSDGDVSTLYWFINEIYIGKSRRDQAFLWQAKPGKFVVRVVDELGRGDATDLEVHVN